MTWDWNFVFQILPDLLVGVWYTILITIGSAAIALIGGLLLAIFENVSTRAGRLVVRFFLGLFKGVPILVLLYFGYYLLPQFGLTLPAMAIGIAVLGLVYAAFCSEVYRGGLITIPAGLRDASVALGLSPYVMWRRVYVPLMIQRASPALINYVLTLFRQTSFLFAIGVPVLIGKAQVAGYQSFRYLEPFTVAGALYLALNIPFLFLLSRFKTKYA